MKTKLISVSEIISQSFALYRQHINTFIQPIAIFAVASVIYVLAQQNAGRLPWILSLIILLAYVLVSIWISVVFIMLADTTRSGETPKQLDTIFKEAYHRSPQFVWVSVLYFLIVVLGFALFIIPGIIVSVWYMFATFYAALTPAKTYKGSVMLKNSKNLVVGRWWATLWRAVAPQVVFSALLYIILLAIGGIISAGQLDFFTLVESTSFGLLLMIGGAIIQPLLTYAMVLLFRSLESTTTSH